MTIVYGIVCAFAAFVLVFYSVDINRKPQIKKIMEEGRVNFMHAAYYSSYEVVKAIQKRIKKNEYDKYYVRYGDIILFELKKDMTEQQIANVLDEVKGIYLDNYGNVTNSEYYGADDVLMYVWCAYSNDRKYRKYFFKMIEYLYTTKLISYSQKEEICMKFN